MAKKGMSLPLETVILLILAAIVLTALLSFFLGFFNPAKIYTDAIKNQASICQQIFAADSNCAWSNPNVQTIAAILKRDVCGRPSDNPVCGSATMTAEQCIPACCRIFCG